MDPNITITYSDRSNGWTSFWSFYPDWMLGMNSTFYTWKDGNLYEHDSSQVRNRFYFNFTPNINEYYFYPSKITTVFNQDPTTNKMFKTLALESTLPWVANIQTDLDTGQIDSGYFEEKEGSFFAYIRNQVNTIIDPYSIATQGIGNTYLFDSLTNTITFNVEVQSSVSILDRVYKIDSITGVSTYLGNISDILVNGITYIQDPSLPPGPNPGDMIYIVKNSVAESYGVRGYYMEVELINSYTSEVELFEVSSSAFKSYP